jgi:hypothetical protein
VRPDTTTSASAERARRCGVGLGALGPRGAPARPPTEAAARLRPARRDEWPWLHGAARYRPGAGGRADGRGPVESPDPSGVWALLFSRARESPCRRGRWRGGWRAGPPARPHGGVAARDGRRRWSSRRTHSSSLDHGETRAAARLAAAEALDGAMLRPAAASMHRSLPPSPKASALRGPAPMIDRYYNHLSLF